MAIGVDLVDNHQVAGFFVKRALPYGAKLVVVDPGRKSAGSAGRIKPSSRQPDGCRTLIQALSAAVVKLGLAKKPLAL